MQGKIVSEGPRREGAMPDSTGMPRHCLSPIAYRALIASLPSLN